MFSQFQKICEENGILIGILAVIFSAILVLFLPILAYGIGYLSGIVCNATFGYLFPFEKVPETFGLISAFGCVFSMGRISSISN